MVNFLKRGLIENIAQSAALGFGYNFIAKGLPIPIGFIGAVKKLHIHSLPEKNTDIYTEIHVLHEVFNITIIQGTIYSHQGIIASCEMKVLLKTD